VYVNGQYQRVAEEFYCTGALKMEADGLRKVEGC